MRRERRFNLKKVKNRGWAVFNLEVPFLVVQFARKKKMITIFKYNNFVNRQHIKMKIDFLKTLL